MGNNAGKLPTFVGLAKPNQPPSPPPHLLSEDYMVLDEGLGQQHGVLDVDVVVGGAVDHQEGAVPYTLHLAHQAGLQ